MKFRLSSVSFFALLTLSACGIIPTQYIPNGYRYEDDTPLSSPQPSRPWTDSAAHPDLDHLSENTAAWQGAVYELIAPLPALLPPGSTRLALVTTPPASVADAAFDHYLRQGLISYGYKLDALPQGTDTVLIYNAEPLSNAAVMKRVAAKYGKEFIAHGKADNRYYLTLGIRGPKEKILNEHTSIAVLPYEKKEYARWPGTSYTPDQGPNAIKDPIYKTRD